MRIEPEVSEYRLMYWGIEGDERLHIHVRRGSMELSDRWAVYNGPYIWNGTEFSMDPRRADAYRYERDEALEIAERLALEENAKNINQMERLFPGEWRGGPYDLSTGEKG